ncbi:MAG: tetratricopeptide repeat protein [Verrucomicrobiia bacterium]
MYLWNTKALAKELRDGTLTERERMKYFLLFMTLIAVGSDNLFSHPEPISSARIILSAINIIATVGGTYGAYRINRAGDDRDFIARAICLSIPLTIRIFGPILGVWGACELLLWIVGEAAPESSEPQTGWVSIIIVLIFEVVYYWRLWHHIAWVSRPQAPPDTLAGVNSRKFGCWLAGIAVALFLCAVLGIGVAATFLCERGINKSREGVWDEAITHFTQAIRLSPQYAPAYYERGVVFSRQGDHDKAIADFDKAIELDPKNARAYYYRAIAYNNKDDCAR